MYSNLSESKLVEPSYPIFVHDFRDGQRHQVVYWQIGGGAAWPCIEKDGAVVVARGHYGLAVDEENLTGPAIIDQYRAYYSVVTPVEDEEVPTCQ